MCQQLRLQFCAALSSCRLSFSCVHVPTLMKCCSQGAPRSKWRRRSGSFVSLDDGSRDASRVPAPLPRRVSPLSRRASPLPRRASPLPGCASPLCRATPRPPPRSFKAPRRSSQMHKTHRDNGRRALPAAGRGRRRREPRAPPHASCSTRHRRATRIKDALLLAAPA